VLEGQHADLPVMLTEFGGIALARQAAGTWGYAVAPSADDLAERYERLLDVVRNLGIFAGFCYTQFTDTYQEANGLLYADRRPKFAVERIRKATAGATPPIVVGVEQVQIPTDDPRSLR
jgi:hypothetical protein